MNKVKLLTNRKFLIRNVSKQNVAVKKSSTKILFCFKLLLSTSTLMNLPPLSTFFSLYGINGLKFCEDFNKEIKNIFFETLNLNIYLIIFKNLTFKFYQSNLRYGFLLQRFTTYDFLLTEEDRQVLNPPIIEEEVVESTEPVVPTESLEISELSENIKSTVSDSSSLSNINYDIFFIEKFKDQFIHRFFFKNEFLDDYGLYRNYSFFDF